MQINVDAKIKEVKIKAECPYCHVNIWTFRDEWDKETKTKLEYNCWSCHKKITFLINGFGEVDE
jgi:DNA-directed RNA polymerase subunit RPC12/RpoP